MSTPMFQQYLAMKAEHPDAILFFRLGDFYETFYEDAEIVAKELELTLTARNKHNPDPVPMAGVPHHAAPGYIQRLVERGYRVAIAEQTEDPAVAVGLVRREVVRVVTPGVSLDPAGLDATAPCYVAAVHQDERGLGLAFLDVSTGEFRATEVHDVEAALAELARLEPKEALLSPQAAAQGSLGRALRKAGATVSRLPEGAWRADEAGRELRGVLGKEPVGFVEGSVGWIAAGAAVRYARDTTKAGVRNVHRLQVYEVRHHLILDEHTRRNLELLKTIRTGTRKGSLLQLLDRTATAMGSRKLRDWLLFPLLDPQAIGSRQVAIGALVEDHHATESLREALREVADIERISARVAQGLGHARDLVNLRRSLRAVPGIVAGLRDLSELAGQLPEDALSDVCADLDRWLVDEPPPTIGDGGVIRAGVHAELDELVSITVEGQGYIDRVEDRERARTGINSLKIKNNRVFGYFIEITQANLHKVPDEWIRKQTLANVERYVTPELKELEEKVLGADERRKVLEVELFVALRERVALSARRLLELASKLASLDVLASLALVADGGRWVAPVVDQSTILEIREGRHPVVEALLEDEAFVPNDLSVNTEDRQLIVITGPNMAGKSTVMRQAALIVVLAQIGSFVPAASARVGLCDRIFTRVGASDDLAHGQSTFMVEMSETAAILHQATARSFVVLDEIGRGTSTYDGLSIAWAVAEDLHDRVGCRTLFATHYHELCELPETKPRVANQSVAVSESGDRVAFLRRLVEGGASRSYGIQCARLAGLPGPVVARARALLARFEKTAPRNERNQLSLFGVVDRRDEAPPSTPKDLLREALAALDPDALSPKEALASLYQLKGLM